MRATILLIAAAFLSAGCATGLSPGPRAPEVWLLMGQSNISGRGDLAQLPAELNDPDPRIQTWGNDGVLKLAREPVDSADGQIDLVSADAIAAVGPGLAFARARVGADPDRRIILVPCARGGTSIVQWEPAVARTSLFGSCLVRAREAARFGRLTGALWYQGESDAGTLELADAWVGRFEALLAALRKGLGQSDLPVLVVAIGDRVTAAGVSRPVGWERVQNAQTGLTGPNLAVVQAAGLPLNADGLHLSTAAQMTLGRRLADAADVLVPASL